MKIYQLLFFICSLLSSIVFAEEKITIGITTLDWPPYEGENLKQFGAHSIVCKAAFEAMGYNVKIAVLPWKRAVEMAKDSSDYIAYYTEYYSDEIAQNWYLSDPLGSAPIGFVERKNDPISWDNYDDLEKFTIGVTDGYINTKELDSRIANKKIKAQVVTEDINGIKKVLAGRIKASVIDPNVLNYFLATNPDLIKANAKEFIRFNPKILDIKQHYLAFRKSPEGLKMQNIFNQGLKKIDSHKIITDYFKELGYTY